MLYLTRIILIIFFSGILSFSITETAFAETSEKEGVSSDNKPLSARADSSTPAAAVAPAKKKKRRHGCSSFAEPRYRKMVRNWQIRPKIPKPKYRKGLRDLTLYSVNHGERIRFFPFFDNGAVDPEALNQLAHLLRDKETDEEHAIHPRLLKLLYRVADKFNAVQINVISGYRAAADDQRESKHQHGMAVDFMVPGTALSTAAKLVRTFGHVGVGMYPVSGFIHMDVRDGPSYFWVDRSGPGKPTCLQRVSSSVGAKYDRKWNPDGDEPQPRKTKKGELMNDEAASSGLVAPESTKNVTNGKGKSQV
jgi:uncharacterized protein YcbK (DUF882 family)